MSVVAALARNTFREAIRNQVLYVLAFFTVLALALTLALGELSVRENVKLVRDLGLAGISGFAVIVAIFTGVNLLYKELERRTVWAIVPKPIRRWQFVVGKFAGMAAVLLVLLAAMALVLAGVLAYERSALDGAMRRALALVACEALVLCAVAVFFSAWTTPFLSGLFTLGVFALGRSGAELEELGRRVTAGPARGLLAVLDAALPNLYLFYPSGAEVAGDKVSINADFVGWDYVATAGGYAAAYVGFALLLAAVLFSRRDFV